MTDHFSSPKQPFLDRVKQVFRIPSIFHGVLTGLILFASKWVFYFSGNWSMVLDMPFLLLSFMLIMYSIWTAGTAERKIFLEEYVYLRALFAGIRVISIALFFSIFADAILYNSDSNLSKIVFEFQVEKFTEANKMVKFIKDADKDAYIKELKAYNPAKFSSLWSAWMVKVLLNSIFAIFMAIFIRFKKKVSFLDEN